MEFKGQYLFYNEYEALGGTLDLVPFNLLEYDVRKLIDRRTFGRLKKLEEQCQEVKLCVFRMIEAKERYQLLRKQESNITSVTTDGYTESYRKTEESDLKLEQKELMNIIETDLSNVIIDNVPILYLGADVC